MNMGIKLINPSLPVSRRCFRCKYWGPGAIASSTYTAGRVYLQAIEVMEPRIVNGITISNGGTIAGEITVGIYTEGAYSNPLAGIVLAESASTAHEGASGAQTITIPDTALPAGFYFLAFEASDALATLYRYSQVRLTKNFIGYYYDRAGGYGTLTNPCPAVTVTDTHPIMSLEIKP